MPKEKEVKKNAQGPINYKARFEKKLYLAQESPESGFDLSDCNLKVVPSNVFALCGVLGKEALYLQNNILTTLGNGGTLIDLKNIKVLNVSGNKISKLPNNINQLQCLEVLDVSKNVLVELPETIGGLVKLISLNVSHNNLKNLPVSIGNCESLQFLDLSSNENLKKLQTSMAKLHSLKELKLDSSVLFPPKEVCKQGVHDILKYLSQYLREDDDIASTSRAPSKLDAIQEKMLFLERQKQEKQNERVRIEKDLLEQNQKEIEVQQKLKGDKKKLLDTVKSQQNTLDANVAKIQEKRSADRAQLVKLCRDEEKRSTEMVNKILKIKRNLNLQFTAEWEEARKAEDEMLWRQTAHSKEIEKRNILESMQEMMEEEIQRVHKVSSDKRLIIIKTIASDIAHQNDHFTKLMKKKMDDRALLLDQIIDDEELQKTAVASLLEKSDAASWELAKQISIIEQHLSDLTRLEISRKKLESASQVNELNKNRMALTELLMNLVERQTIRRHQLIDTIRRMEIMRETVRDAEIYWMDQYNKLLKSKGLDMVEYLERVDPAFVYELYVNGVFHFLPLLKDIVTPDGKIGDVKESVLLQLGIKGADDRTKILRAIKSFLEYQERFYTASSPSLPDLASTPSLHRSLRSKKSLSIAYLAAEECVVCMETRPVVVFIPCGHLCCCMKCFKSLTECPLCRKRIDLIHTRLDLLQHPDD